MGDVRWWLSLAAFVVACGGDGDAGTATGDDDDVVAGDDDDATWDGDCEQRFDPCGGDPTGTWAVASVCEVATEGLDCPDLTFTIVDDRSSGSIQVNGDHTYTRDTRVDVDIEVSIPKACVAPVTCGLLPTASLGLLEACSETGDHCDCQGTITWDDAADGDWMVVGTDIVFDGTDRQAFCVTGGHAKVKDRDGNVVNWSR